MSDERKCHACGEPTVNKYCENSTCEVYKRDEGIKHDFICDGCGKTATRGMELRWVEFPIDKDGRTGDDKLTSDDGLGDCKFYCDNCDC